MATPFLHLQQIPIKPTTKQPIEKAQSRCHNDETHIPLVMEGDKQLRNRHREEIVALASRRKEI
jgi:type IV pilus biogenesis protein CpaD/CtpE